MADASLAVQKQQTVQLTVAGFNSCHYCTAAHVAIGKQIGIAQQDASSASICRPRSQYFMNIQNIVEGPSS